MLSGASKILRRIQVIKDRRTEPFLRQNSLVDDLSDLRPEEHVDLIFAAFKRRLRDRRELAAIHRTKWLITARQSGHSHQGWTLDRLIHQKMQEVQGDEWRVQRQDQGKVSPGPVQRCMDAAQRPAIGIDVRDDPAESTVQFLGPDDEYVIGNAMRLLDGTVDQRTSFQHKEGFVLPHAGAFAPSQNECGYVLHAAFVTYFGEFP